MANCKRLKKAYSLFDKDNSYTISEAIDVLMKYKAECPVKFDESVDVAIRLGVDTNKGDQNIKSFVELPHGNGKKVRIVVFANDENIDNALAAPFGRNTRCGGRPCHTYEDYFPKYRFSRPAKPLPRRVQFSSGKCSLTNALR